MYVLAVYVCILANSMVQQRKGQLQLYSISPRVHSHPVCGPVQAAHSSELEKEREKTKEAIASALQEERQKSKVGHNSLNLWQLLCCIRTQQILIKQSSSFNLNCHIMD